ncbi:MAG: translocation and assembly module TamB [Candidatus Azotimanducaceae bacterium]|jgi:translocation and assembly module TamB
MRTVRMLAWSSRYLLGLVALLVFLVWLAVATTTGSRLVFSQVGRLLDGQLTVGELTGKISGPLRIQKLQSNSGAMGVRVELIELDWLPSDLLSRWRVQVEMLRIQGLQVALLERGTPEEDNLETGLPDDLSLPLPLQINNFAIDDVTVTSDASESGEIVSLQSIVAAELSWLAGGIEIRQLSIKSPVINFTADAQLKPRGDWPLSVDARYSLDLESQQLPNATGTIALSGSLLELGIVQTIDSPYSLRIEASVNEPLMTPQWQAILWAEGMQLASFDKNLPTVSLLAKVTAEGDADPQC